MAEDNEGGVRANEVSGVERVVRPHENKPRKATHALAYSYVGGDGIKREMHLARLEDASVAMHFITYWDGEDAEPTETGLSLGVEAFNQFGRMLQAYHCDRERYALTDAV